MNMPLNTEWIVTSRVYAEAHERHDAGIYGTVEFTRAGQRWRVTVAPGHIEARKVGPPPHDPPIVPLSHGLREW